MNQLENGNRIALTSKPSSLTSNEKISLSASNPSITSTIDSSKLLISTTLKTHLSHSLPSSPLPTSPSKGAVSFSPTLIRDKIVVSTSSESESNKSEFVSEPTPAKTHVRRPLVSYDEEEDSKSSSPEPQSSVTSNSVKEEVQEPTEEPEAEEEEREEGESLHEAESAAPLDAAVEDQKPSTSSASSAADASSTPEAASQKSNTTKRVRISLKLDQLSVFRLERLATENPKLLRKLGLKAYRINNFNGSSRRFQLIRVPNQVPRLSESNQSQVRGSRRPSRAPSAVSIPISFPPPSPTSRFRAPFSQQRNIAFDYPKGNPSPVTPAPGFPMDRTQQLQPQFQYQAQYSQQQQPQPPNQQYPPQQQQQQAQRPVAPSMPPQQQQPQQVQQQVRPQQQEPGSSNNNCSDSPLLVGLLSNNNQQQPQQQPMQQQQMRYQNPQQAQQMSQMMPVQHQGYPQQQQMQQNMHMMQQQYPQYAQPQRMPGPGQHVMAPGQMQPHMMNPQGMPPQQQMQQPMQPEPPAPKKRKRPSKKTKKEEEQAKAAAAAATADAEQQRRLQIQQQQQQMPSNPEYYMQMHQRMPQQMPPGMPPHMQRMQANYPGYPGYPSQGQQPSTSMQPNFQGYPGYQQPMWQHNPHEYPPQYQMPMMRPQGQQPGTPTSGYPPAHPSPGYPPQNQNAQQQQQQKIRTPSYAQPSPQYQGQNPQHAMNRQFMSPQNHPSPGYQQPPNQFGYPQGGQPQQPQQAQTPGTMPQNRQGQPMQNNQQQQQQNTSGNLEDYGNFNDYTGASLEDLAATFGDLGGDECGDLDSIVPMNTDQMGSQQHPQQHGGMMQQQNMHQQQPPQQQQMQGYEQQQHQFVAPHMPSHQQGSMGPPQGYHPSQGYPQMQPQDMQGQFQRPPSTGQHQPPHMQMYMHHQQVPQSHQQQQQQQQPMPQQPPPQQPPQDNKPPNGKDEDGFTTVYDADIKSPPKANQEQQRNIMSSINFVLDKVRQNENEYFDTITTYWSKNPNDDPQPAPVAAKRKAKSTSSRPPSRQPKNSQPSSAAATPTSAITGPFFAGSSTGTEPSTPIKEEPMDFKQERKNSTLSTLLSGNSTPTIREENGHPEAPASSMVGIVKTESRDTETPKSDMTEHTVASISPNTHSQDAGISVGNGNNNQPPQQQQQLFNGTSPLASSNDAVALKTKQEAFVGENTSVAAEMLPPPPRKIRKTESSPSAVEDAYYPDADMQST